MDTYPRISGAFVTIPRMTDTLAAKKRNQEMTIVMIANVVLQEYWSPSKRVPFELVALHERFLNRPS